MSARPIPFGDGAWRIPLPEGANARAVLDALLDVRGVVDAVVCERHGLVSFDPSAPVSSGDVARAVEKALTMAQGNDPPTRHVIPVRYDGIDLDDVARLCGLSPGDLIAVHTAADYTVVCVGFLPGFAYLGGLDARLQVPRRATPRPRVPALSIAIAGPYTGVYPFASPGGWNIVGTALGFAPFDPASGAALALGDHVRFARADS